ncbi:MAG: hypothetical protein CME05_12340 [Gemmatimonadaceae bacterium]|nr:hypothetical protein [Gemmatimonadaceae bacterium]
MRFGGSDPTSQVSSRAFCSSNILRCRNSRSGTMRSRSPVYPVVEFIDVEGVQHGLLDEGVVAVGPVELHGLDEADERIGDEASPSRGIARSGVQHIRVTYAARHLAELLTVFDLLTEARIHRTKTLGELLQIAGDGSQGVGGDEGSTTTGGDVRPQDDGQQPLFGAVEEMPEPVPILVPSRRLCRGLLPVLVGTDVEVNPSPQCRSPAMRSSPPDRSQIVSKARGAKVFAWTRFIVGRWTRS